MPHETPPADLGSHQVHAKYVRAGVRNAVSNTQPQRTNESMVRKAPDECGLLGTVARPRMIV